MRKLKNIHPGDVLLEEFLEPMGLSQNALGRAMGVAPRRVNEIILNKRGVSADTSIRLAKVLGTTPEFWLNLQASYDLEEALKKLKTILPKLTDLSHANDAHFEMAT